MPNLVLAAMVAVGLSLGTPLADMLDESTNYVGKAEAGDAEAQFQVGQAFLYGMGTKADAKAARSWLTRAATQGNVDAQFLLATLDEQGIAGPVDLVSALKLFRAAAAQGETRAAYRAGHLLRSGAGTNADFAEAAKWLGQAAACDEPEAQLELGLMARLGQGMAPDAKQATVWFERAASQVDDARYFLKASASEAFQQALELYWGARGPADQKGAQVAFVRLANGGQPAAMFYAARTLADGSPSEARSKEAETWYRKSAEAGYAAAQVMMSRLAAIDVQRGLSWARLAAAQGDPVAELQLGAALYLEQATREEGRGWLEKAARQGNAEAAYTLSTSGQLGLVVGREPESKAQVDWLTFAAERGNRTAQHALGTKLVERGDAGKAIPWLERAAKQRDNNAAIELGDLLSEGKGLAKDLPNACRWYLRAYALGDENGLNRAIWLIRTDAPLPYADLLPILEKMARRDDVVALTALGTLSQEGHGVPKDPRKALGYFRRAAEKGDQAAMVAIGKMYADGVGVPRDDAEALRWFEKALPGDGVEAKIPLARMIREGRGTKKDVPRAIKLLEEAGYRGLGEAYNELGLMFEQGLGVPADLKKARDYYRQAASNRWDAAKEHLDDFVEVNGRIILGAGKRLLAELRERAARGDAEAQYQLASMLLDAEGDGRDPEGALVWLQKAARGGHAGAQFELARLLESGVAVRHGEQYVQTHQDPKEARRWFEEAANHGNVDAMMHLADSGWDRPAEVFSWTLKAAKLGRQDAKLRVAELYANGTGTAADGTQALAWAEAAGKAGYGLIAKFYDQGSGVKQDLAIAAAWYEKAAKAGDVEAAARLGEMHEHGQGVALNVRRAIAWYKQAAQQYNALPAEALARLYFQGPPEVRNEGEALRWHIRSILFDEEGSDHSAAFGTGTYTSLKAKYHDMARACYELARMLDQGKSLPKDPAEATTWYTQAAGYEENWPHTAFLANLQLGLRQDPTKAMTAFEKARSLYATKGGNPFAVFERLGANPTLDKDFPGIITGLEAAGHAGFSPACLQLAWLFDHGADVPHNERRAKAWREAGLRKSDPITAFVEGSKALAPARAAARVILASEPLDRELTSPWTTSHAPAAYTKAMKAFDALVEVRTARAAKQRPGQIRIYVVHDEPLNASELKEYAAAQGVSEPEAQQLWSAARLMARAGLTQDPSLRFKLTRQAADLGDGDAMEQLAVLHARGIGTAKNPVTAYQWMVLADLYDATPRGLTSEELAKALTAGQRSQAQEAALQWWERHNRVKLRSSP